MCKHIYSQSDGHNLHTKIVVDSPHTQAKTDTHTHAHTDNHVNSCTGEHRPQS